MRWRQLDDSWVACVQLFGGVRLAEPTGPNRYASAGPAAAVGQDHDSQKSALFAGFNVEASAKSVRLAQMDAETKAADAKREEEEADQPVEVCVLAEGWLRSEETYASTVCYSWNWMTSVTRS